MPWNEDPSQNYWKYARRPDPSYEDYEFIKKRSDLAQDVAYTVFTGGRTIKYKSSSVSNAFIMGSSPEYQNIQQVEIKQGRYFTPQEERAGANKLILGSTVADELFGNEQPIGKSVKIFGQKFQVVAKLEPEGENMFNFINFDEVIWVPFATAKKYVSIKDKSSVGRMLNIKVKEDSNLEDLTGEVTGILRAKRRLKPLEEDNFAINEVSLLTDLLDDLFSVLSLVGIVIGFFALLVGMFSVANIMFVSVRERTNIIGIKKALGAKKNIILLEFLVEAVILCIFGGLLGLALVLAIVSLISAVSPFQMTLSFWNIAFGVGVSVVVGIVSGILPAFLAAKLDPVEAIRA